MTATEAQSALSVLTNDARRQELIGTLETIVKAQGVKPTAQPAPPTAPPTATTPTATTSTATTPTAPAVAAAAAGAAGPAAKPATPALALPQLLPGSLGQQLIEGASDNLAEVGSSLSVTVRTVLDLPLLSFWFAHLVTDPVSRAAILDAAWRLALVLAVSIGAEYLAIRLLRSPIAALERRAADIRPPEREQRGEWDRAGRLRRRKPSALLLLWRMPYILGHLALDLLPIAVVAAIGYSAAGTAAFADSVTRLVISAVLYAYILCRIIGAVTRGIVAPREPRLRLIAVSDHGADFALRWTRRLAVVGIFGYTLVQVGLLFGLYSIAHDALLRIVALAWHVLLIVLILQARRPVARRIRARDGARGPIATFRNWLAPVWHWFAIFYSFALWFVWAFEITDGMSRLIRACLVTGAALLVARLVAIAAVGGLERALGGGELTQSHPTLAARMRGYQPILRTAVGVAVVFAAGLVILESWGLDSIGWLQSNPLGGRLMSAIVTVAATLLLAFVVWEMANVAVDHHLDRLAREAQIARSARLRTLLPMLRTALFAAIVLFAGLTILSEIGVNIAPLLAGAGVVGLAIGFGSQKLVQDIITGLFLLLENAMQVGDVVSLGGLSGTVEALSVRTIRLRALDGSVHIVPFSAVTTVTNMTRDYSYALVDVNVGLNEEPDRVSEVLSAMVSDMRREPRWATAVRDDLEVMGVERFVDLAWVLRVRVKTLPSQRWAVTRELNRRIKYRFDELAIESPFTSHRVLSATPAPAPVEAPRPAETSPA
ncbi:MAG: mechanosensitive ion channel [Acetobacteraceae bacterium]|nr:mechanosensitive ion channel [Acetobacteraceae bacterium]